MRLPLFKNTSYPVLLSLLLILGLQSPVTGQELFESTTVWQEKENNIFTHFVYGLTVTKKGSILTFAEARIKDASDDGAHHIVMKRSVDSGKKFSSSRILVRSVKGQSWANPTPIVDHRTGSIFLFYALNHENASSRVFFIRSKNDGKSWSSPKEVTSLFKENKHEWTFHLPGPGHGIQLKNGRLMLPVWHRRSIAFPSRERNYGVNVIYSDDGGENWLLGGETPVGQLNESQLAQKANGDLLLIGRTITGVNGSKQAKVISTDWGLTWSDEIEYVEGLKGVVCDIGLIRYADDPNMILVSQPSGASIRENLVMRISTDEGATWNSSKLLQEGRVTYSDLALLPDKTVVCLFGKGGGSTSPVSVVLIRFNRQWLVAD